MCLWQGGGSPCFSAVSGAFSLHLFPSLLPPCPTEAEIEREFGWKMGLTHDTTAILMGKNLPSVLEASVKSSHFCRNVKLQLSGCSQNRWISILGYDKDPNTDSSAWQGKDINPGAEEKKEAIWKDIKRRWEQIPRLWLVNVPFCWLNCETVKLVIKGKSSLVVLAH